MIRWLNGPRSLSSGIFEDDSVVQFVDAHFIDRIRAGDSSLTEEEIRSSGLDERTVENLILNLRIHRGEAA